MGGFSAHADQAGLTQFVSDIPEWPGRIILVHGEAAVKTALAQKLSLHRTEQGATAVIEIPN